MKTTLQKTFALIAAVLFLASLNGLAQDKKEKTDGSKMHIKIKIEKDGKTTKVDTTINAEDLSKLNEQLKDLDVHIGSFGDLAEIPDAEALKFEFDGDKLNKQVEEAMEKVKDMKFDSKEFEERMKEVEKNLKEKCKSFKFEFNCDSAMNFNMDELNKEMENLPGQMNFDFNFDDGVGAVIINDENDSTGKNSDEVNAVMNKIGKGNVKTVIINSNSDGGGKNAGKKKIIIKGEGDRKAKKNKKEEKRVIIIMKSSGAPEKQKAEFAAEPVKEENEINNEQENNTKRVRIVNEMGNNSWLNNFACYPNPSSGEFTLRFNLTNPEPAEVKIFDLAGREVYSDKLFANSQIVEKQIRLPENSSSAYLLILRQGNNWLHEKIFVKS